MNSALDAVNKEAAKMGYEPWGEDEKCGEMADVFPIVDKVEYRERRHWMEYIAVISVGDEFVGVPCAITTDEWTPTEKGWVEPTAKEVFFMDGAEKLVTTYARREQ